MKYTIIAVPSEWMMQAGRVRSEVNGVVQIIESSFMNIVLPLMIITTSITKNVNISKIPRAKLFELVRL